MNNIINKFLLAGDRFMLDMHLGQPRFVYSACGPFTRHKERIKQFKHSGDTRYIYINELVKASFQHDLINRTEADNVLRDKVYDIGSNPKYDGYQRGLAGIVYKIFDKKSTGNGITRNTTKSNSSILADELHKLSLENLIKEKYICNLKIIYGE